MATGSGDAGIVQHHAQAVPRSADLSSEHDDESGFHHSKVPAPWLHRPPRPQAAAMAARTVALTTALNAAVKLKLLPEDSLSQLEGKTFLIGARHRRPGRLHLPRRLLPAAVRADRLARSRLPRQPLRLPAGRRPPGRPGHAVLQPRTLDRGDTELGLIVKNMRSTPSNRRRCRNAASPPSARADPEPLGRPARAGRPIASAPLPQTRSTSLHPAPRAAAFPRRLWRCAADRLRSAGDD